MMQHSTFINAILILLSIFATFFLFNSCVKENNPEFIEDVFFQKLHYEMYNSITDSNKIEYIYDDFISEEGFWPISSNTKRDNGIYIINANLYNDKIIISDTVNLYLSKLENFEIEFELNPTTIYGESEYITFLWGADTLFSDYPNYFFISVKFKNFGLLDTKKFKFSTGKYELDNNIDWFESKYLNYEKYWSDYKKITIRKIKNYYYIFIDNQLFAKKEYENLFGNKIAFKCNTSCKIKNFKINKIENLK